MGAEHDCTGCAQLHLEPGRDNATVFAGGQMKSWRKAAHTVLLAALLALCWEGCRVGEGSAVNEPLPAARPFDLGAEVYAILRANLAHSSSCPSQKVAALEERRDRFIGAINHTIDSQLLDALPGSLQSSVLPLVDDGSAAKMSDAIGYSLALLVDDEHDPKHSSLQAIVKLMRTRSVLSSEDVTALVGRLLAYAEIEQLLTAVAGTVRDNDGVDDSGQPNSEKDVITGALAALAAALKDLRAPELQSKRVDLIDVLLQPVVLEADSKLGAASWAVRADVLGNPAVAVDPATSKLYTPFVDLDDDGVADVDNHGQPIDSGGQPIAIPPFDHAEQDRDDFGRALAHDGGLLYEYFDAKRTGLSLLLQLVGEIYEHDLHRDLLAALVPALGKTTLDDAGTPYDSSDDGPAYPIDNPVAALLHGGLDALRYRSISLLLDTWAKLVKADEKLAERVIILVSKLLSDLRNSGVSLGDVGFIDIVEGVLPLVDELAEQDTESGQSTLRLLLQVVHDLGSSAAELPAELAMTMVYADLSKSPLCSEAPPDLAASTKVDYSKPRYYQGPNGKVDNRSGFEKNIALMAAADGCKVPLDGRTLAQMLLETLATLEPKTVCTLIDVVMGVAGLPLIDAIAILVLDSWGCDGKEVFANLQSLRELAEAGMLDAYIPITRVFVDRGETRTLIDFYHVLQSDFDKDEDADPASHSVIRKAEPLVIDILQGEAPDTFFELLDLMVDVEVDSGKGDNALDVFADALSHIVDDDGKVTEIDGTKKTGSTASLLLGPWREIATRVAAAGAVAKLENFVYGAVELLTKTHSEGGIDKLDNRFLVPLAERLLTFAADLLDLTEAELLEEVAAWQKDAAQSASGMDLAALIELWAVVDASDSRADLDAAVVNLLSPSDSASADLFGALLRLLASALQTNVDPDAVNHIGSYLAELIRPPEARLVGVIDGIEKMVALDDENAGLVLLQNLFDQGADGRDEAPLSVLIDLGEALALIDPDTCQPRSSAELIDALDIESMVESSVEFIHDDDGGLGAIYRVICGRVGAPVNACTWLDEQDGGTP